MFHKDDHKEDSHITGFIGAGMKVEGKLTFEKTVRIDGSFKGEINSAGALIVGNHAFVEGEIKIGSLLITGEVKGTINAAERVELQAPARVCGEIKTPTLIIGEGTTFDGKCVMIKGSEVTPATVVQDTFRDLMKKSV